MHAVVEERDEHALLCEGDATAWRDFYCRVYPLMVAYARRRLGGLEAARDAVAEALARTVTTVARMEELGASPEAWGFGILRNVVVDAQRRAQREWRVVATLTPEPPDAAERAAIADEHEEVRRAFERLPERDRELLELRTVAGLSSDEVGSVLSMNPGAVRMAHARALARLRDLLEVEP
jgi:RNA polymerase sigma-70 factor (ECF subfamily)